MRFWQSLLLVPAATALLYACGHDDAESLPPGDEDVLLEGNVTDETFLALRGALDQGAPADVPSQAATLDQFADGDTLPRASAPVFTWHFGAAASRGSAVRPFRWAGLRLAPERAATQASSAFREIFGPVRSAHAHGDPFNGNATYLVFSVDSDPKLVRVFTGATSYTPAQEAWDKMVAAGKPITLTLISAIFEDNRIVPDGGPFTGSTTQFTVAP